MALTFIIPGLDEAASEKIIGILQNRLSQEQEAALVLKHAHWNVTGENFIAVHEMIDPQVEAVLNMADETAERIARLTRWTRGCDHPLPHLAEIRVGGPGQHP